MNEKRIYLLRHAPKGADGELTDEGRLLASQLKDKVPTFSKIISSSSQRAIDTTRLVTGENPEIDERAKYFQAEEKDSDKINELAQELRVSFLVAAYQASY